jgi:hypothetical protein
MQCLLGQLQPQLAGSTGACHGCSVLQCFAMNALLLLLLLKLGAAVETSDGTHLIVCCLFVLDCRVHS